MTTGSRKNCRRNRSARRRTVEHAENAMGTVSLEKSHREWAPSCAWRELWPFMWLQMRR